ncbi:MAG: tetratricopeptide repeat protein [Caldilineaceae bacterium]
MRQAHQPCLEQLFPPDTGCNLTTRASRRANVLDAAATIVVAELCAPVWNCWATPPWRVQAEAANAAAIVELLEQIPLALVLAGKHAARLAARRQPSPHPLASTLDALRQRRAQVLDQDDTRDLSMRITFDLSFAELSAADGLALAQLSVFGRNQFPLDGVQRVWQQAAAAARPTLHRLSNAGLLEEIDDDLWWMHDLLRELAGLHLNAEERAQAQHAHAAWVEEWLTNLELRDLDSWAALTAWQAEIEAAGAWLLAAGADDGELAVNLAVELGHKCYTDYSDRRRDWLRAGLALARQPAPERNAAMLMNTLADLLSTRGQYDEAERLYRESLAVKEKLGDSREVAVTQSSLALLMQARGDYDEAERLFREGLQITQQIRDLQGVAVFQMRLGQMALWRGNETEGRDLLAQARQGFVAIGLPNWAAMVDQILADFEGGK